MEKLTPLLGWIGFTFGVVTAVCAPKFTPVALLTMLPGFLLSSLYVLFSSRYELKSGWINPGYTGMLLSSTPLMLLIYFQLSK